MRKLIVAVIIMAGLMAATPTFAATKATKTTTAAHVHGKKTHAKKKHAKKVHKKHAGKKSAKKSTATT